MSLNALNSPRMPLTGRVCARARTSSVKRSVLAMSMRFSYDARIRRVVAAIRSTCDHSTDANTTTSITNSIQEFRRTGYLSPTR